MRPVIFLYKMIYAQGVSLFSMEEIRKSSSVHVSGHDIEKMTYQHNRILCNHNSEMRTLLYFI